MGYYELQKLVFDHLYSRHQQDNNFTFSVRRKFSKGKEKNYFTGTQKSGYFGFTLWFFPCYYRGASIEAATFLFDKIEKDHFNLSFQFFTSREPTDELNAATLALGPEIYQRASAAGMQLDQNDSDKKMYYLKITKQSQIPFSELAPVLDSFIDEINQLVEPSITVVKAKYPKWEDGTITKSDFDKLIAKLTEKLSILNQQSDKVLNVSKASSQNFFWLNCNPKIWRVEDFAVGQEQTYTSHNEAKNKRNAYESFLKVKPGDLLIGYESTPTKKVKAIFEVTQELHQNEDEGEIFAFKIKEFVPNQADWNQIKELPALSECRVIRNNQGSLFELSQSEFEAIYAICKVSPGAKAPVYDLDVADKELFIERNIIQEIQASLARKKNIILQGAPGVGKTFFAKRLAYLQMGKKDESRVEMIQFHQSYAYEDFIRGFRPNEEGKFTLANGVFYEFCRKAQNNPDQEYFFIIDEINRGNLSKIFGELMMLIEADKRGPGFAIPLTYRKENEPKFYVPENVYIIGTMNTADRSLALVDYALRRRFAFWNVVPKYETKFKQFLLQHKAIDAALANKIAERLTDLNKVIGKDKDLGVGFMVGHSYFCNIPVSNFNAANWYAQIVDQEIKPLLQEYWYDNEARALEAIKLLSLN